MFTYEYKGSTLNYDYSISDSGVSVVGISSLAKSGILEIPESVLNNDVNWSVVGITEYAIENQKGLIQVIVPDSVSYIKDEAF
jgi:hypothetical protein